METSYSGSRSRRFLGRRRLLPSYRLATSRCSWCCFRKIEDRSAMAEYVSSRQDFTVITMIEEVSTMICRWRGSETRGSWGRGRRRRKVGVKVSLKLNTLWIFSYPVYRHPSDESPPLSPFTPTIALIREHVQKVKFEPLLWWHQLHRILGSQPSCQSCPYPTLSFWERSHIWTFR